MSISAAELKVGQRGVVSDFQFDEVPIKLLEMGCLPGMELELKYVAPFEGALFLRVADHYLAIRRDMAEKIFVELSA